MTFFVLFLVLCLALANGSNDVPKGVATLVGAGVANVRTAITWGAITTAIGCLVSLRFASKMTALFSKGIVSAKPTPAFAAAVLIGTVAWVALATWRRLPVSTTHALVGALLGAGVLFSSDNVQWHALVTKVVRPLLLSVLIAWAASALLATVARLILSRVVARRPAAQPAREKVLASNAPAGATAATADATHSESTGLGGAIGIAHWLTSGLTSFARGMNDTPKIVAIGSFALIAGMTPTGLLFLVTIAMAIGGLVGGRLVAARLANDVVKMSHAEGFAANLTTAVMVSLGAFRGLPMSTTHVSIGAITGLAGTDMSRLKKKTVRDFALAWLVTPPFAAAVAALAYLVVR
jgi:inorganic phosphate transporter, PiT family